MANEAFVDSIADEIIEPGIQRLMESRYFSELREGQLSVRRLQGWSLQHYLHNIVLLKGFALCMVKNAHDDRLYNHFSYQFEEERTHPIWPNASGWRSASAKKTSRRPHRSLAA